jgi:nucleoside-triphosphatase THEP1
MDNTFRIGQYCYPEDKQYGDCDTLKFNNARSLFIGTVKAVTPPLTIGLYGPWGSGKSTMIRGMVEQLQKDNYLTLVFDAWKYRHEKNLILPLLCALQRENKSHLEEAEDSACKVVGGAAVAILAGYIKHKTGIDLGDIRSTLEMYEDGYQHYKKYDDYVANVEGEYKTFIGTLLKKTKKDKLVIFVDNLDRCLPDVVVNLLEDISSFLSIPEVPCVYVLAMDREHVIKAIKHRFPDFDGVDYLEKIVQIPLKMPISADGRYHFMKRFEWAKKYDGEKALSQKGDSRDQIFQKLATINDLFSGDLLGNPRRMERIVNKFIVLEASCLFFPEKSPDDISIFLFLMLLGEYFPRVYRALKEERDIRFLVEMIGWSKAPDGTPQSISRKFDRDGVNVLNKYLLNEYISDDKLYGFLRSTSIAVPFDDQTVIPKILSIKKTSDLVA